VETRARLGAREHPVDGIDEVERRLRRGGGCLGDGFVARVVGGARSGDAGGVCHSIHFVVSLAV